MHGTCIDRIIYRLHFKSAEESFEASYKESGRSCQDGGLNWQQLSLNRDM